MAESEARLEPGPDDPSTGGDVLARLSSEMVRAQKEYFGKGPTSAKTYVLDDLLVIVMRGGMTTAEKTMLEFGREDEVRRFRQVFENDMTERLTSMVEEVTGRKVVNYQSQVMFDPDVVVEMFVFDRPAPEAMRASTAEGQLGEEPAGEVEEDAEPPPGSER